MAIRAKVRRSTPKRGSPVVASRPAKARSSRKKPAKAAAVQAKAPSGESYRRALRYLHGLTDFERLRIVRYNSQNFDLARMRLLLKRIGNPHQEFRSVHVAGTKGKGSTCAMIAAMLEGCGYKVGLYTSPHLTDVRERIRINGKMIPQTDFARLVRRLQPTVSRIRPTPTYFDVLTAIAFAWFAEQGVEIAVVETGLGGRLDSTNVLHPEITAVTSISKDHMAQLGNTLAKIAAEKAGIFKRGVPAVTVAQEPEAEAVLKQTAESAKAPFDIVGKSIEFSYRFESSRLLGPHNRVCLSTPHSRFEHLAVPLLGEHQAINCGLALAVIDRLKGRGIAIDDNLAREGLARTVLAGRMEMINPMPRIVVDAAHNAASLDAAFRAIGQHIPYDSLVVIFGCCTDKDVSGMLNRISAGADKVIFTRVNNIRSADPEELAAQYIELYGKMAQVAPNLQEALRIANRAVTREDLICITGSFYLIGEAKKLYASER